MATNYYYAGRKRYFVQQCTDTAGIVKFQDIEEGKTLFTIRGYSVVKHHKRRGREHWRVTLVPQITINNKKEMLDLYYLHHGAKLAVVDGQKVAVGDLLTEHTISEEEYRHIQMREQFYKEEKQKLQDMHDKINRLERDVNTLVASNRELQELVRELRK